MRIVDVVKASSAIQAVLGANPIRFFPFEYAVIAGDKITRPYAVWTRTGGAPDNSLSCRPTSDRLDIQIDVYADSAKECKEVAAIVEYALELDCHITRYMSEQNETGTKLYRTTFMTEWFEPR
jgi:hypothetical protein